MIRPMLSIAVTTISITGLSTFGCAGSPNAASTGTMGGSSANAGGTSATASLTGGATSTSASGGGTGGGSFVNAGGTTNGASSTATSGATRTFMMGSTPFFSSSNSFPDWQFENMDDRDLLSLHVDDFWGVPWDQCSASGCSNLPATWVARWQDFASRARATNKPIYLAVSPLGERKNLARRVLADGTLQDHWVPSSAVDSNGCYLFSSDSNAARYKAAYIAFVKYLVDLIDPDYVSPAIEMNIPFTSCVAQQTAWKSWYADVHNALKTAYPNLVLFPTFQLEHLYGISDAQSACDSGVTTDQCFTQRLQVALTIPGDRFALSTYPFTWKFSAAAGYSYPANTYSQLSAATSKKIWISETGWNSVPIRSSYSHAAGGTCGSVLVPASFDAPGLGTIGVANDSEHAAYISWLLNQAQVQKFEAVIWWLNRDYLDATSAAACPCAPTDSETCKSADQFYAAAGDSGELSLRLFANMGLRNYDGIARPGYTVWKEYLNRSLTR